MSVNARRGFRPTLSSTCRCNTPTKRPRPSRLSSIPSDSTTERSNPILYLSPSGKWVRRVSFAELTGLKPKPPLFIEITQALATKWLWANGYPVPACAAPVEANARIRNRRGPSLEQQYAHRLWHEGHLSQAEVALELQRLFHVPFAQSQVSRAIKLVDDWLQSIKADAPANRARRSLTAGPSRNEPSMPGIGKRLARKEVDDDD